MTTLSQRAERLIIDWSIPVLPVREHLKRPAREWANVGQAPEQCLGWWSEEKEATGAWMACGALPEGYLVLDCDFEYRNLDAVLAWLGIQRPEVEARSASGRCHLFLKAPQTPALRLSTVVPPELLGGSEGKIEVRSCQFKAGLMMVGSFAKTKSGNIGAYSSESADRIWSLDWSGITEDELVSVCERLGSRHWTAQSESTDEALRGAVDALRHGHIGPLMRQHQGGIDLANEWATTYGNLLGRLVRSYKAVPEDLANEAWKAVLDSADEASRSSLTNDIRHNASFVRVFATALKEEQAARRQALYTQIRAHIGDVPLSEDSAKVEVASVQFFGGGVRATLVRQPNETDEWRISVLSLEHMAAAGAILADVDLGHPLIRTISLDCGFATVAGVEPLQRIALLLGLPRERIARFRESKIPFADLKNLLAESAFVDRWSVSLAANQIASLVEQFDRVEYRVKFEALAAHERSRHAWHLAPRVGKRVGPQPFIVEHQGSLFVAVSPYARKHFDPEQLQSITRGGKPDLIQCGPNRQEVRLYAVREGEPSDA